MICFKASGPVDIEMLSLAYVCPITDKYSAPYPLSATHFIEPAYSLRYYSPTHTRGNWGTICTILMNLFSDPSVMEVWYYGDHMDPVVFNEEDVIRFSRFYMQHGNRPYYERE